MKTISRTCLFVLIFILGTGLACQLTSPTPASWSGTPTAEMRAATNTAYALTQQARPEDDRVFTPTASASEVERTMTPRPTQTADGPWLLYLSPAEDALHLYDIEAKLTTEIQLPQPVVASDLVRGYSSQNGRLIMRAGSSLNADELALYQIDLPSTDITKVSPLLSLALQRKIVNEEGLRAPETLQAIIRADGLAWSPNGRFLAFTAALDNDSSDLYVYDTQNDRVERLNGLYSQNASPFWSPGSDWLVSQELGGYNQEFGWRSEIVTGLRIPGFDDQNTLYLPISGSRGEVILGWINAQNFISYSLTDEGAGNLQQVNVENKKVTIIFEGLFDQAAFDPNNHILAFSVGAENAIAQEMFNGVYLLKPEDSYYQLQRAGDWKALTWDPGGMFVSSGSQGCFAFSGQGESLLLSGEGDMRISPNGNWIIAWGDGDNSKVGARLYQAPSDRALQTVIDEPVGNVFWGPDSLAFFIRTETTIYHLAFPGLNPVVVEEGFLPDADQALIWVD